MALDFSRMLAQLSPARPIDLGSGQKSYAREQLELARQQFEETKKQHEEDNEIRRLTAANTLAAAQLGAQKAREKAAAAAAAKLQEQRLAGVQKVSDLAMAGNGQGMLAMSPVLDMLGGGLEVQGQSNGLPRVRVIPDRAAEAQQEDAAWEKGPHPIDQMDGSEGATQSLARMDAEGLGYPSNDQGTMDTAPLSNSDQTDASGLSVADRFRNVLAAGGKPTRGPDEEDDVGGVPRDVIDMGALHSLTMKRLNPALAAAGAAYTDEASQKSAAETAKMAELSGLPMDKALEAFDKGRQAPDALRRTQLLTEAQQDKFRETRDDLTPKQIEEFKTMGKKDASEPFKNNDITGAANAIEAADTVTDLMKGDKRNQEKAVNYLMMMTHNKGPQTEADALRVVGQGQLNSIEKLEEWLHGKVKGGFSVEEKNAIQEFVDMERERNEGVAYDYLDRMNARATDPTSHELRRAGVKQFVDDNVPNWLRDKYEAQRKVEQEEDDKAGISRARQPTAGKDTTPDYSKMDDFDLELEGQAMENDLDPDKLRPIVRHETRGLKDLKNETSGATGIIQFMPTIAKGLGTSTEAIEKMSPTEQIPLAVKYLQGHGITADSPADDYAMAVAAPAFIGKPDSTVVYPKSDDPKSAWAQNAPWRPADGGDITVGDILKFYGLRGGGKRGGSGSGAGAEQSPAAAVLAPKTELDQAVKEALGL